MDEGQFRAKMDHCDEEDKLLITTRRSAKDNNSKIELLSIVNRMTNTDYTEQKLVMIKNRKCCR